MRLFVVGDLVRVLLDRGRLERHLRAARDAAHRARARRFVRAEPGAVDGDQIILRFQIFQVQGEVQDVGVGERGSARVGPCRERREPSGAEGRQCCKAGFEDEAAIRSGHRWMYSFYRSCLGLRSDCAS